jgi:hypothetical protein
VHVAYRFVGIAGEHDLILGEHFSEKRSRLFIGFYTEETCDMPIKVLGGGWREEADARAMRTAR